MKKLYLVIIFILMQWLYIAGLFTALFGAFEIAYDAAAAGIIDSPIWSGTFGYPVLHHYLVGFIALILSWAVITAFLLLMIIKHKNTT